MALSAAMNLSDMLNPPRDLGAIGSALDQMSEEERVQSVLALGKRELANLFEAAADSSPLTLTDIVPADVPPLTEVIHEGKNSLPLFTRFQKRFCRPSADNTTELWGYNEQAMRAFTGPGYLVLHFTPKGELVVDYGMLPPSKPEGWPEIIPNSARLSRFIYHGTVDVLRRVSRHVTIGRAFRKGKGQDKAELEAMDAWFVLVRREVAASAPPETSWKQ